MTYTIISIVIVVAILFIIIYINYDYNTKYKKSEKDLYYEAVDLLQAGKLKEAYSTLLTLIKNDTNNVGKVELSPKFEGRQMIMIVQPI